MKRLMIAVAVTLLLGALPGMSGAVPAPPVLSHTETGLDISISWTAVPGATGYTLLYAPYPFAGVGTIGSFDMQTATGASFHLWEGAAYYLAVQAYDGSGSSDYSNIGLFIMGPPTPEWVDNDGDGFHENSGDCDDSNPLISPAQPDLCDDGIDQDCSGADAVCNANPVDGDSDGYTVAQGDCDDGNPAIHPGAADVCADGIDQDCSGADRSCSPEEIDNDHDGFTENQGDCDDSNATINPQAVDLCEDGIDQDCSGSDLACPPNIDDDGDGFTENQGDCDDTQVAIHPGATEACGDGVDQDCSGADLSCETTTEAPLISPAGGNFSYGQVVSMTTPTAGAKIYYTTNGGSPNFGSAVYSEPIEVNSSQTVKAMAYLSGMNRSPLSVASFDITPSLTGNWAVAHITGTNNCQQEVGGAVQFNANVVQSGSTVTVTTQAGTGSGTINGSSGTWTTSQPVSNGSMSGTLTFTMNVTVAPNWKSFSGPTSFKFSGDSLNCSGVGTITGTRIE